MKHYTVAYKMIGGEQKLISVPARTKYEAVDKAEYEAIPAKHNGEMPYSVWVYSVTYNNGNYKTFNASEGNCYGD